MWRFFCALIGTFPVTVVMTGLRRWCHNGESHDPSAGFVHAYASPAALADKTVQRRRNNVVTVATLERKFFHAQRLR